MLLLLLRPYGRPFPPLRQDCSITNNRQKRSDPILLHGKTKTILAKALFLLNFH